MGEDSHKWLAGLNERQRQAVERLDGPVLVLAGAGTGKTRVLTTRLAQLIHSGRAAPYEILCVTFTNKAAREMRERVESLIGESAAKPIWLGTFHSIAVKLLRKHAALIGLSSDFTILGDDDQIRLIKRIMEETPAMAIDSKKFPPRLLLNIIQSWKDRGESYEDIANEQRDPYDKIAQLYELYQTRLRDFNAVDFGDLLFYNLQIFKRKPDILALYHRKFRYILVDEFQDTNTVQYLWLRLLAQEHKNICCVGDDDQSIYSWRGAQIGNIINFDKDFPGAEIIRLECNYRSTPYILHAASGLIAHNAKRHAKTLWTESERGERLGVIGHWDSGKEAGYVARRIESVCAGGERYSDIAILVRAGFLMRSFEERLFQSAIPYQVVGGAKFYDREEVRDAIAYLRSVANSADNLAFERIVNKPSRGIGDSLLRTVTQAARERGMSYFEAAETLLAEGTLTTRQSHSLSAFVSMVEEWRRFLDEGEDEVSASILAQRVLRDSGYMEFWERRKETDPQAEGRLENLNELLRALDDFATVREFLEHVALISDNDSASGGNKVSLMTLHASKGLEFGYVFLPAWEEGIFPNQRAIDEGDLEEERRLAYVGLTRAKHEVMISYANRRFVHGNWVDSVPSRFLGELPEEDIIVLQDDSHGADSVRARPMSAAAGHHSATDSGQARHWWHSGDLCRHAQFGVGTIIEGGDNIVRVEFAGGESKSILSTFLRPE